MCAGPQECDCKRDWLWVRSPHDIMKYLFKFIFSFLRSEFHHLTHNASETKINRYHICYRQVRTIGIGQCIHVHIRTLYESVMCILDVWKKYLPTHL